MAKVKAKCKFSQSICVAAVSHSTKNLPYQMLHIFKNSHYHTSFEDLILSGATVATTSHVCVLAISMSFGVRNSKV
jgi:hypothetical protein